MLKFPICLDFDSVFRKTAAVCSWIVEINTSKVVPPEADLSASSPKPQAQGSSPCAPAKKQSVNLTITDCFLLFSELFESICFENENSIKVFPRFSPYWVIIGGLV